MNYLLVISILAGATAYWLYHPPPPGYSDPWKFMLAGAASKVIFKCVDIGHYFGLLDRVTTNRYLWHNAMNRDPPTDDGIKTHDAKFNGVKVRIYKPDNKQTKGPGLIYLHGGGWVMGSVDIYDNTVRYIVKKLGVVAVSVDYRLAPEHPFPVPMDDCVTAVKHFLENAESFDVDPARVAVVGDSAGGNLVAAVLLKLRDTGFTHKPKLGVMIYPALQSLDLNMPSYQQGSSRDPLLTPTLMARFWLMYAQSHDKNVAAMLSNNHVSANAKKHFLSKYVSHDNLPKSSFPSNYIPTSYDFGNESLWTELEETMTNPYFAPLLAKDLRNLPASDLLVVTVAHDVLRDDGILFAKRLKKAGNSITHIHLTYGFHGMIAASRDERDMAKSKVDAYREIFKFVESKI